MNNVTEVVLQTDPGHPAIPAVRWHSQRTRAISGVWKEWEATKCATETLVKPALHERGWHNGSEGCELLVLAGVVLRISLTWKVLAASRKERITYIQSPGYEYDPLWHGGCSLRSCR